MITFILYSARLLIKYGDKVMDYIFIQNVFKKLVTRDFPACPVVKTSSSNTGGAGLILGQEAKIPHTSGPKNQNLREKQHCNKFNKDLKNRPHQKKT